MESQIIYIELELVLDIYSLIFCSVRFYLERNYCIEINNKEVSVLYGKTLHEGVKDLLAPIVSKLEREESIPLEEEVQDVMAYFMNHAGSLKPTVPAIHVLNELKKNSGSKLVLFSYLQSEILNKLIDTKYHDLVNDVKTFDEIFSSTNEEAFNESTLIIFGSLARLDNFEALKAERKVNMMHVTLPKQDLLENPEIDSFKSIDSIPFENFNIPKIGPSYEGSLLRVELNRELDSPELPFWKKTIPLEKIKLTGRVVNGFKRGSKELGVPTANMDLTEENSKKIHHLLPGVYCGTIKFLSYESNKDELIEKYGENFSQKQLRTAISIGWNPSYDNSKRTIEAYILEEFDNDFYGEELEIEMTHYIRAESNYSTLDHLIMAIHNDIETTKHTVEIE